MLARLAEEATEPLRFMMTYQFDYGKPYTIPIYGWYLEGGDKRILVDTGEMRPVLSEAREKAIGGPIHALAL